MSYNIQKFDTTVEQLIANNNWNGLIAYLNEYVNKNGDDVMIYVESLFFLHDILIEVEIGNSDRSKLKSFFVALFKKSRVLFSDNPNYLFFVGYILNIAEWNFDLHDNSLAKEFVQKAYESDRENKLFLFANLLSTNERIAAKATAQEIKDDPFQMQFLLARGFAGKKIVSLINFVINGLEVKEYEKLHK